MGKILKIIFHASQMLWVRLTDVMTSSHRFFFSSFMLFISTSHYDTVVKMSASYCFLYSSYRLFDSSDGPGMYFVLHLLGIYLLEATCTLSTNPTYFYGMGSTYSISLSSLVG